MPRTMFWRCGQHRSRRQQYRQYDCGFLVHVRLPFSAFAVTYSLGERPGEN
jgi:hypothetical protein